MHAVPAAPRRFAGFSRECLELLRQLEENNNATWFECHRQLFRDLLVEPAVDLVIEIGPLLRRLEAAGGRLQGHRLRRVPRPFPADHERASLLQQLGLRFERTEPLPGPVPEAVLGPVLPELLVSAFVRLEPLRRWLLRLG